jgi:hypothetical protein
VTTRPRLHELHQPLELDEAIELPQLVVAQGTLAVAFE